MMIAIEQRTRTSVAPEATRKDALRAELEATRRRFHKLVAAYDGPAWRQNDPNTKWTFGEVLVHLTSTMEDMPKEVACARHGRGMYNFPPWLRDPISLWYFRWMARNASPTDRVRRYGAAIDDTLHVLDAIGDDEWERGANFYGEGYYTIEDLFHVPAEHLAHHTQGWPLP